MRKFLLGICLIILTVLSFFIIEGILILSKKDIPPYGSIILFDSKGHILTKKGKSGGFMIPYTGSLDRDIVRNIVEIEDNRFWEHSGIDIYAKVASLWQNIKAGGIVRGGSTITEQYIKNRYYPGAKRTILQKFREGVTAMLFEIKNSKEDILRGYLSSVYFGNNIYGLVGAEQAYNSGIEPSPNDILDIITRINSPNIRKNYKSSILSYRKKVQNRLKIGSDETNLFDQKYMNSINRYPFVTERIQEGIISYCHGDTQGLLKWTIKIHSDICHNPLTEITLSIDGDLMEYTRTVLESTLESLAGKNVTNGAIYIFDPTKKKILTYIGNRQSSNRGDSAVDMIRQRRSVGSVLKPFIYLLALELGHDTNEFILDDTKVYPTEYVNKGFIPMNYVEKSYGPVRMREALGNSLNSSTVRLSEEIGIGRIYDFFRKYNLDLNHDAGYYGYGISLGGVELTLQNIVESYGNLINLRDPNLFLLEDVLKDPTNRSKTFGISSILNSSIPLPVKTGTSTDFRDNWTISYHKNAIIGVWVGNSDASPMEDVSGVSGAGPIWHSIAEYMISRKMIQKDTYTVPSGLSLQNICLDKQCFQKELRYSKREVGPESRPKDHLYYEHDFITRMTSEEKKKWEIKSK